jgi:hypothetical protein
MTRAPALRAAWNGYQNHENQSISPVDLSVCNTAELSGELSKGDVVVVGGVALAVASVGWNLVSGDFDEVRGGDGSGPTARLPGDWPCQLAGGDRQGQQRQGRLSPAGFSQV